MKEDIKFIMITLVTIAVVLGGMYYAYAFFSPKYAEVRNATFKNSQAYNDGMASDMHSMQVEYLATTDPDVKAAIGATIKQRFASYPKERLPQDLRDFYSTL